MRAIAALLVALVAVFSAIDTATAKRRRGKR